MDQNELIEKCKSGDEAAWELVVERYQRLIYSIGLNLGLSQAESADILQQTFISLMDNIDRLRPNSNLGGWLSTVARRNAYHYLRKKKREAVGQAADIGESEGLHTSELIDSRTAFEWDQLKAVHEGLDRLGERCQKLLLALYFDPNNPSYTEIAKSLGISVGSIGPIRGRCLERLRERMADL